MTKNAQWKSDGLYVTLEEKTLEEKNLNSFLEEWVQWEYKILSQSARGQFLPYNSSQLKMCVCICAS